MDFHGSDPAPLVEATFRRIHAERMAGMPMVNPRVAVAAVGFERRDDRRDEWRGVLVTPWGIGLLLLPAVPDWPVPPPHERAFRTYPAGSFAFLPNREDGLGAYLLCSLVHDMTPFADHETALLTAQASLIALEIAPTPPPPDPAAPASPGRRGFLLHPTK